MQRDNAGADRRPVLMETSFTIKGGLLTQRKVRGVKRDDDLMCHTCQASLWACPHGRYLLRDPVLFNNKL
jgi:hypothetical protein